MDAGRYMNMCACLVLLLLLNACCSASGQKCEAAEPEKKPHSVEFIFSNLCNEKTAVTRIDVTVEDVNISFPAASKGSQAGGQPATRLEYGEEVYLDEAYFFAGTYRVTVSLGLNVDGESTTPLEGYFEIQVSDDSSTVEIILQRGEEGCRIDGAFLSGQSSQDKCIEPTTPDTPEC